MSLSRRQQRQGDQPGRKKSGTKPDCSLGHPAYRTKAEAATANPGAKVTRCGRCRFWKAS